MTLFEHVFPALGDQLTYEDVRDTAAESATRSQSTLAATNADTLGVTVDEYEDLSIADITERFVAQGIDQPIEPTLSADDSPWLVPGDGR